MAHSADAGIYSQTSPPRRLPARIQGTLCGKIFGQEGRKRTKRLTRPETTSAVALNPGRISQFVGQCINQSHPFCCAPAVRQVRQRDTGAFASKRPHCRVGDWVLSRLPLPPGTADLVAYFFSGKKIVDTYCLRTQLSKTRNLCSSGCKPQRVTVVQVVRPCFCRSILSCVYRRCLFPQISLANLQVRRRQRIPGT